MSTFETIVDINQPEVHVPSVPEIEAFTFVSAVPVSSKEVLQQGDGIKRWVIKPASEVSWALVKKRELIKMTPYSKGIIKVENHIAQLPRQSAAGPKWNAYRKTSKDIYFTGYFVAHSTWMEQVSLLSLLKDNMPYHPVPLPDYSKELNEVKSNVVNKSMNGLDLLTNLAELPAALEMVLGALKAARHPIQSMRDVRERYVKSRKRISKSQDSTKAEKLKELDSDFRNQWLQYRYGIMPLVLTIKDAIKLLDESLYKFHTEHSGTDVVVSATSKPAFNVDIGSYIYQNVSGVIKIRATGKAKYGSEGSRLSDLITVNPFLTAWELIPLSFVIDWFVNVGDVIFSNTSALMDISEQRSFCYSVKKEITTQTILYSSYDDTVTVSTRGSTWYDRPDFSQTFPLVVRQTDVLRTENEESYDRVLFSPTDVDFKFNPSLNWMRQLDAYALSFSSISKQLKKLR